MVWFVEMTGCCKRELRVVRFWNPLQDPRSFFGRGYESGQYKKRWPPRALTRPTSFPASTSHLDNQYREREEDHDVDDHHRRSLAVTAVS